MEKTGLIERLNLFGLTRQEATIYLTLLEQGELSGYEAAKLTGISRSNVYSALSGLMENGASYIQEGESSKYIAVPLEEFCTNKIRQMEEAKGYLAEHVSAYQMPTDGYITIEGARHVADKIHGMILNTKERLYLSANSKIINLFMKDLNVAIQQGIKVVIISDTEYGNSGAISYKSEHKDDQIRLITDSTFVLTGDLQIGESATCLYSGQQNFVRVFKDALRNEIKLLELGVENHGN